MGIYDDQVKYQHKMLTDQEIADEFMNHNEWNFYKRQLIKYEIDKTKRKSTKTNPFALRKEQGIITLGKENSASTDQQPKFIHGIDMPVFHSQTFNNQL